MNSNSVPWIILHFIPKHINFMVDRKQPSSSLKIIPMFKCILAKKPKESCALRNLHDNVMWNTGLALS